MEGEWRSENHAKLFDNVVNEWLHVSDDVDLVTDTLTTSRIPFALLSSVNNLLSSSFNIF